MGSEDAPQEINHAENVTLDSTTSGWKRCPPVGLFPPSVGHYPARLSSIFKAEGEEGEQGRGDHIG